MGALASAEAALTAAQDNLAQLNRVVLRNGNSTANQNALKVAKEDARIVAAQVESVIQALEPAPTPPPPEPTPEPEPTPSRLWGLWDDPGTGNMIWNSAEWDSIESQFGKLPLVHYGDGLNPSAANLKLAGSRGGVPFLDWGQSIDTTKLLAGAYDANLAQIQKAATEYGKEIIFRPLWEMNGNWYTWGQKANYAEAWRYMRGKIPAQNLKWLWCPNYRFASGGATDPTPHYPGDAYVDYVGADIYMENWTAHQAADLILSDLHRIAPSKQGIIGEWGVSKSKSSNRTSLVPSSASGSMTTPSSSIRSNGCGG